MLTQRGRLLEIAPFGHAAIQLEIDEAGSTRSWGGGVGVWRSGTPAARSVDDLAHLLHRPDLGDRGKQPPDFLTGEAAETAR